MPPIVNVAAYRFADLQNLKTLREELRELCAGHHLRGTILLSPEGINLFVAGERSGVSGLLDRVRQIPGLEQLEIKESISAERPFKRMRIRIKAEIIAFGIPEVAPARSTSRRISPCELKRWLDEGRPVTLLDTRNNFEVELGTFRQAMAIGIDDFRNFPTAATRLPESLRQQPVITFCTGGIRCEKAAPYMERLGFKEVYQLDGGILKYFEECGGAHYQGTCFVFDDRVTLNAQLQATAPAQQIASVGSSDSIDIG